MEKQEHNQEPGEDLVLKIDSAAQYQHRTGSTIRLEEVVRIVEGVSLLRGARSSHATMRAFSPPNVDPRS